MIAICRPITKMMILWVVALGRKGTSWIHQVSLILNLSSLMAQEASHLHESTRLTLQPSINNQNRSCKPTSPNFISNKLLGREDSLERQKQALLLKTAVSKSATTMKNWCWRKEQMVYKVHLGHKTLKRPYRSQLLIDNSRRKFKIISLVWGLQLRNRHRRHLSNLRNSAPISLCRRVCPRNKAAQGRVAQTVRMSAQ